METHFHFRWCEDDLGDEEAHRLSACRGLLIGVLRRWGMPGTFTGSCRDLLQRVPARKESADASSSSLDHTVGGGNLGEDNQEPSDLLDRDNIIQFHGGYCLGGSCLPGS